MVLGGWGGGGGGGHRDVAFGLPQLETNYMYCPPSWVNGDVTGLRAVMVCCCDSPT